MVAPQAADIGDNAVDVVANPQHHQAAIPAEQGRKSVSPPGKLRKAQRRPILGHQRNPGAMPLQLQRPAPG